MLCLLSRGTEASLPEGRRLHFVGVKLRLSRGTEASLCGSEASLSRDEASLWEASLCVPLINEEVVCSAFSPEGRRLHFLRTEASFCRSEASSLLGDGGFTL